MVKGRWLDNRFIERLWRSLKYEDVYLNVYETMRQAGQGIGNYFTFYNASRPHQSLSGLTPDEVYQQTERVVSQELVEIWYGCDLPFG